MSDILSLAVARECGASMGIDADNGGKMWVEFTPAAFTAFVQRIRADQRERDALKCEAEAAELLTEVYDDMADGAKRCAAAIRSEGDAK